MKRVGIATIGQAPRTDVVPLMRRYLGEAEVIERGALDDLDAAACRELAPSPGEPVLVTRLRDGTEVKIGKRAVTPRLQVAVDALESAGADLCVILCTSHFPLQSRRLLVEAGPVVDGVLRTLAAGRRLGMVMPAPEQVDGYREAAAAVTWASPYAAGEAGEQAWRRAAEALRAAGVDLVYLNCMGMRPEQKALVARVAGVPVVLANTLVARVVAELL